MRASEALVERLREKQGDRTQSAMAKELGITQSMLSRLYRGEREIGIDLLLKVAVRYPDIALFFFADYMSAVHRRNEGNP